MKSYVLWMWMWLKMSKISSNLSLSDVFFQALNDQNSAAHSLPLTQIFFFEMFSGTRWMDASTEIMSTIINMISHSAPHGPLRGASTATQRIIPMTHAPEIDAENRLHFSGAGFWSVVSYQSGTGFVWYQKPAPIRTLFYSKPETGVHMTEIIIYHLLLFIFVISCK